MDDYRDRAKRYHESIRAVLLREWDPIGVAHVPQAQDEYDGYVPEIYTMLIRHSSPQQVFEHLWWIETQHMGLCGNRRKTEAIAERLCAIRRDIERTGSS
jgi:hypothetical protein